MNDSLSSTICSRAMWCHLSGLTWLLLQIFAPLFQFISFFISSSSYIFGMLFPFLAIAVLSLPFVVPILVWRSNRRLHPFVDIAGKAAVNFIFTISLLSVALTLLGILMIGATCGILSKSAASSAGISIIIATFGLVIVLPIALMLLFHIGASIYAAFRAYKGEVYTYPMTINFLK